MIFFCYHPQMGANKKEKHAFLLCRYLQTKMVCSVLTAIYPV